MWRFFTIWCHTDTCTPTNRKWSLSHRVQVRPGSHLVRVHVDPDEEDELGHEEAAAQVLVDSGSGALDLAEEPEGEDAHGQTDERDDHPQLGDPGQDGVVGHQLGSK